MRISEGGQAVQPGLTVLLSSMESTQAQSLQHNGEKDQENVLAPSPYRHQAQH